MKQEKWIKFMPLQKEVSEILKQVPRGVRGVFIEQAILEFASKKPSIHFHFDGITKPKRKRRSKEEIARDLNVQKSKKTISNDLSIEKSQNLQNKEKQDYQEQSKGKMMFNFANIK